MNGFTLVEVVVAASIILVFLLALFGVNNFYLRTALLNTNAVKASYLAEEGLEAVRFLRDSSWDANISTLTVGASYYLVFQSDSWQLTTTPTYVDGLFERKIILSNIFRDTLDDIASSGTLDPGTKLVTVNVSWYNGQATTTKSLQTYISRIRDESR